MAKDLDISGTFQVLHEVSIKVKIAMTLTLSKVFPIRPSELYTSFSLSSISFFLPSMALEICAPRVFGDTPESSCCFASFKMARRASRDDGIGGDLTLTEPGAGVCAL